jgi:hypothetical protein
MSTSSEERRRTEAALVRAIDVNSDAASPETHAALCAFVDVLLDEGLLPEAAVIAFKSVLSRSESLYRLESELREHARAALVSACIDRYFTARVADDVRVAKTPSLRLVREDEPPMHRSPDAPA